MSGYAYVFILLCGATVILPPQTAVVSYMPHSRSPLQVLSPVVMPQLNSNDIQHNICDKIV